MFINWNYLYKSIVDHKDYIDFDKNPIKYYLSPLRDNQTEEFKLNPIFEDFRRINMIRIVRNNNDLAIKFLTLIKDLRFKVSEFQFDTFAPKDAEVLTNPKYFHGSVDFISCSLISSYNFSDKFFDNLQALNSKQINFKYYGIPKELDWIRILNNLKCRTDFYIRNNFVTDAWEFSFANVPIYIKSNNQDPIFIKWEQFVCYFDIDELNKTFWFTEECIDDIRNWSNRLIRFIHSEGYEFINTSIVWEKELKQFEHKYSEYNSESEYQCEFFIPMRYLKSVKISDIQTSKLIRNWDGNTFMNNVCCKLKNSWIISFSDFIWYIDQCISLNQNYKLYK